MEQMKAQTNSGDGRKKIKKKAQKSDIKLNGIESRRLLSAAPSFEPILRFASLSLFLFLLFLFGSFSNQHDNRNTGELN